MATPTGLLSWPPPNNHHSQSISSSLSQQFGGPITTKFASNVQGTALLNLVEENNIKHWFSWQMLEAANEGHETKKTTGD
jgi:hypothetical protein